MTRDPSAESDSWHTLVANKPETRTETSNGDGPSPGSDSGTDLYRLLKDILILTGRDGHTADAVIEELSERGENVVRYDTAGFPTKCRLAVPLTGNGWAGALTDSRPLDPESVTSVWWRRPNEFVTPEEWPDHARAFAVSEEACPAAMGGGPSVLPPLAHGPAHPEGAL